MELSILAVCIVLLFVQHLAAEARIHKSKIPQEMHKYSLHELMNSDVSIDISKGESKSPFCVYPPLSHDPPSPSLPPPTTPKSLPSRFRPPPPAYTKPEHAVWCVAKPTIPTSSIQQALDYACASGADCEPIKLNGFCYQPDTVLSHASYAFNSYWQKTKNSGGTCDFGGTAILVTVDPSYDRCHFIYS
ncbi:major pollen allergen Ole e 10-like isoform X1 [Olea europaea var. sylvestris]|uniref:major pollen allergen Ole e 10-like isoform X1 n=1 Tax=Olea europaea var. sylvestris TaxID=158386 RepID=UPI000C1D2A4D|nr:major pollen allergen Ole e 10-like isoform X1 [Olea europaea var. sylvestris]